MDAEKKAGLFIPIYYKITSLNSRKNKNSINQYLPLPCIDNKDTFKI
jgi:hypothetical protein